MMGSGPPPSSDQARQRMVRQRRRDTRPELALRRLLHARGYRYRVDARLPITGVSRRGDLLFPRAKVAVMVDSCFWHACPLHGTRPKANRKWWQEKLESNVYRDRDTDARLEKAGWTVIRVWEHESAEQAADRVMAVLSDVIPRS